MATTTATAAREQRRLGRENRRDMATASGDGSGESTPRGESSEPAAAGDPAREAVRQASPAAAALLGAAVGVVTGVLVGQTTRKRGNEISGDVAVHLLNRIELLTIRLQVRQARRGRPTEIDVHHIQADASSRP